MTPQALDGVRVLEVAAYLFAPAGGAVLADWGADVIKVEPAQHGDPMRSTAAWGLPALVEGLSYTWEVANRGKRAVAVDLATPDGLEIILGLAEQSDVFVTNFLPDARRRLGIDVGDVTGRNPRIVYARASAQGPRGAGAERGGFDAISYWARSGAAASVTPRGSDSVLNMPGPGFGDVQAGMALAGGIAAALYQRERTGQGAVVDVSLLSAGLWAMQPTVTAASLIDVDLLGMQQRDMPANPLVNEYRTQDGRFVALAMLQADRYWPEFCLAVDRLEWLADPRLADGTSRRANARLCVSLLDELFASHSLSEWKEILSRQEGQWDVVQTPGEVPADPQANANGYVQHVEHDGRRAVVLVPAPAQFNESAPRLTRAPTHGEHTDEVLADLGFDTATITQLRTRGVVS